MKKITNEEFTGLSFAPKGKAINPTVLEIVKLNINEAMIVRTNEWPLKMQPSTYFYQNSDKFNGMAFKVRKLANNDGWAIQRIA